MPFMSKLALKRRERGLKMGRQNTSNSNSPSSTQIDSPEKTKLMQEIKGLKPNKGREREYSTKDSGNRLVHWDSLRSLLCSNLCCNKCGASVKLCKRTVGIATQVEVICTNKQCGFNAKNDVRRTDCQKNNFRKDSSASFAVNCQFVIYLMQIGGGATEAGLALTYLELPNASTFEKTTYRRIHNSIRPAIVKVTNDTMIKAREGEVLATVGESKYNDWKSETIVPDEVKLTTSYDMGWISVHQVLNTIPCQDMDS